MNKYTTAERNDHSGSGTGLPSLEANMLQDIDRINAHQENVNVNKQPVEDVHGDESFSELEHLLSGQQGQWSGLQPRTQTDGLSTVNNDLCQQQKQQQQQHQGGVNLQHSSDKMTQHNGGNNSYTNSSSHSSQLDIRKFPPDMQYDELQQQQQQEQRQQQQQQLQQRQQQQNGATIILTPTLLNATTATSPATAKPTAPEGGGAGPNDADSLAPSVFKGPKIWLYLVERWPIISEPLAIFIIFLMLWIIGYILLPKYAVPSSGIMRIAFLFVGAQISGILVTFLRLPDMLGMLFFGVFYTNVGLADFSGYQPLEAFLREMALINIMLLAGLGLDWNAFKKLWLMILRLTLIPTIAEVTVIAILARLLLSMTWLWGILLGLVITAVSPNVVVTVMLKLKEERLGLNSGIHTLIYAMTTCNDVVAIFVFGVILGVIFSTGTLTDQILQGPIGIGIGIVFGYLYGAMLQFVPSKKALYANGQRFVLTVLGGTVAVMGSKAIGYPSAGALGCVTVAFVAGIGWKRQMLKLDKQEQQQLAANDNTSVAKRLDLLWKFLKPVSFSLIGKEINFSVLDGRVVGYGLVLVLLGSLFRLGFAYISTYGGNLSRKERAYITISGFPKATVQAALGPVALDLARSLNANDEDLSLANNVLIISVLAIIFTAPIGAILMLRLAPIWLKHSSKHDEDDDGAGDEEMANGMPNNDNVMNSIKYATENLNYNGNKSRNFDVADAAGSSDDATANPAAVADDTEVGNSTKRARHLV